MESTNNVDWQFITYDAQKYLTYFYFNDPVLSYRVYNDSGWTKRSNLLQSSTSIIKSIIKVPPASLHIKVYYNGLWSTLFMSYYRNKALFH